MSRQRLRDGQERFDGGLNTVTDPYSMRVNQFRLGQNARHTEYGAITKRYGNVFLATGSLPSQPLNATSWQRADGSVFLVANCVDGELYYLIATSAIGTQAWAKATTGPPPMSTTVPGSFAEFLDSGGNEVIYIADDGLSRWNGGGGGINPKVNRPAAAGVRVIKVHNERLWGVGVSARPSNLLYSGIGNGDSLADVANGGGEIVVRTYGNDRLVGLASVGSSLLIFHEQGVSRLTGYGQDDVSIDPEGISAETGTIAPFSIVEVDGGAFFVSDRGVFIATESAVRPLGTTERPDPILPILLGLTTTELSRVRAVLSRRTQEIWVHIPGVGVYVYHLILGAWSGPWIGQHATMLCYVSTRLHDLSQWFVVGIDGAGAYDAMVCDYPEAGTDATTIALLNDGGNPILWSVLLRRLMFKDDTVAKTLRDGYCTAQITAGSSVRVRWETNLGQYLEKTITGSINGTWSASRIWSDLFRWPLGVSSQNYDVPMNGSGYYVDIELSHDGADTPIVSSFMVDAFALGRR